MIRIIVKSQDGFPDGTAGVPYYQTFDINDERLEKYLGEELRPDHREVVGAEVIAIARKGKADE